MNSNSKASEYGIHANAVMVGSYNRYFSMAKPSILGVVTERARRNEHATYTVFVSRSSGTGSSINLDRMGKWSRELTLINSLLIDECILRYLPSEKVGSIDIRSTQQHLENIKKVFTPAVSDLAKMFGVSRQAVYKWISGSAAPESDNALKINRLSEIADKASSSGVERTDYLLNIRAFKGQSMLDLFAKDSNGVDDAQVDALLREVKIMERANTKVVAKGEPTNDWLSSESIPGSVE
ncbi:helix-turn-helix transcriptional regulator [Aeromonas caviae]|uniref:helix-turn-helix domain-containing protein n=1 Tax=Aeromonas caviae TaxID=648 RepID=UPI0029DC934D|nr:helix-turn-helix transcriptional regulator [Aeromonas caviae]MDX7797973.1 helix-turn-helix transcriptional regulator [Aeromonas caviae]